MSGHSANPIFLNKKKIKTGRPEYSLSPTHLRPVTSYFCLIHPTPLPQSENHMCITPYLIIVLREGNQARFKLFSEMFFSMRCRLYPPSVC